MKANTYRILLDAVEKGIDGGYYRAHKHTETPDEDQLKADIYHYVMMEICEYFNFDEADDAEVTVKREPEDGC